MQALSGDSLTPSARKIRDLFDRIAPVYDDFNQQLSLGLHRVWKQMAVEWAGAAKGKICLDVCCGSGDLALLLAKAVGNTGQVYGLDFSAAQLAIARRKTTQQWHTTSPYWIQGDALALPFQDATFDVATMGYGLRNLTDIPRGLQELQRVLKPGARAAILDFHRSQTTWIRGFQEWYLSNIVVSVAKQCGFTEEYAYISSSLERFPTKERQIKLGLEAGFSKAVYYPIASGLMGVLVLTH